MFLLESSHSTCRFFISNILKPEHSITKGCKGLDPMLAWWLAKVADNQTGIESTSDDVCWEYYYTFCCFHSILQSGNCRICLSFPARCLAWTGCGSYSISICCLKTIRTSHWHRSFYNRYCATQEKMLLQQTVIKTGILATCWVTVSKIRTVLMTRLPITYDQ